MKIERIQMSSGESYSILFGKDGMPLPYQNLFVTFNYRNYSVASETSYAAFEHLRFLEEICEFLKIDLIERCKAGDFLDKKDFENLRKCSKFKVESFREQVAKQQSINVVQFNPERNKLETARAIFVKDEDGDISPHTAYNRLTTFAQYIGWLEEQLFPSKESNAEFELKKMRPAKFGTSDEHLDWGEWSSLSKAEVIRVLDVVRPDSDENPWKSESVKYRNQLIVNMYDGLGCRRGELLKIRVKTNDHKSDIRKRADNGTYVALIRSEVDKGDKRKVRPEGKTLGRYVPMDSRLGEMYENYLIYHRPNATGSEYIEYLFVTHNNKTKQNNALSLSQVNKIFRDISKVVGFRVHPHAHRHAWNDRFSDNANKRIAEKKTTEAKSESDRQKLQGWSENSKMAQHYSKRHEDKRAMDAGLELQEKHSSEIESIVGQYDQDIPF
ncbi:site-specific integrase [Vibrio aestuarianus]|uniref:Site-specific integrase n=4 Tax=Vibrio aestuarianus TaxID=28171 RepID=A0ABM9FL90_9VIBR|nr:site-specific integrase [Vibrio aestuarianus]EGR7966466.1 site-specific integrase [Vibrio vulnificus]EHH1186057.1 site-specific integrase [Vibrio vulnificus]MDE1255348.1 site-specific integrase [Vibrio aestuarianus]MDE1270088.1 site-specific integrase [Vibrio aestuarianus]MDE1305737.1 site-specific integrase [Vibrio aestuarianus]